MLRRQFELAQEDVECLAAMELEWETIYEVLPTQKKVTWVIFPEYKIPEGYNVRVAKAAIRLNPAYPDADIDMVYFAPALALTSGKAIKNLTPYQLDNTQYQQWSRHRTTQNPWRPGVDSICSHMIQVNDWLQRELKR